MLGPGLSTAEDVGPADGPLKAASCPDGVGDSSLSWACVDVCYE